MGRVDYKAYGASFAHLYDRMVPAVESFSEIENSIADVVKDSAGATIVELGVGTGRVAIPLAGALNERLQSSVTFIGVDVSLEMLERLRERDDRGQITSALADMTVREELHSAVGASSADVVLCVGGTFPQIQSSDAQRAAFTHAAELLRPGGRLIVECHNPPAVRDMVAMTSGTLTIRYPSRSTALVWFTSIDDATGIWDIEEVWVEGEVATWLRETTLLTSVEALDSYAQRSDLVRTDLAGPFGSGASYSRGSMMYTATYEKRA
jgi:SAM-dependent methyltransferase